MPTFRLTLSYDGTDFAGWQMQRRRGAEGSAGQNARTVQATLEEALARLADGRRVRVVGAGRTDAGVHALGQVASFELEREMAAGALMRALNALLPADLRVLEASAAPPGFHARKDALSKLYRYELDTGPLRLPLRRRTAGHVPWRLDEAAVASAAALYVGTHDFASTASSGGSVRTTVRTVTRSVALFMDGPAGGRTLVYEVEADGFLRKMVRSLVGGLIAAGRGAVEVKWLAQALALRDRRRWPPPAEACGLTLVRVDYGS